MANERGVGDGAHQAAGRLAGALRSMAVISGVDGAALMMAPEPSEPSGLRAVGGSTPEGLNLQYAQQFVQAGPAHDAVFTGHPVAVDDLDGHPDRPGYARLALTAAPVRAVLAVPVQVGGDVVGALNFYQCSPCTWTSRQIAVGEHLADTAAELLVRLAARPAAGDGAHGRP
ncbi:GAF domain-containing protein [Actinomadura sp. NAK00032]|uniref:GAF domain-containing protein n=1 Tax=Actinomadura sp. NAK00032 TaxID=2742128 RepID=UPI0015906AC8|nr:GAF domain-containing protein [Actinomadura sp. NAK00032]QKW39720.1 GAF domain-containing protein [Actinomadura sp. NAK00032]